MARAIPDDNLALPVLAEWDTGSMGSGFYARNAATTFFVTAGHVLFDPGTKKLLGKTLKLSSHQVDPADTRVNQHTIDMSTVDKDGNVKSHAIADVGVIRIAMASQPPLPPGSKSVVPGVTITGVSGTVMMMVPLDTNIKLFAQALVANEIFLFGYPRAIGLPNIPQIDYSRAILRKGIIAQKNLARKTLIIDAPVYGGNSGGPVIELEREGGGIKYRVVGVAIQLVPGTLKVPGPGLGSVSQIYTHSGYSVVEPMDPVLDLVNSF